MRYLILILVLGCILVENCVGQGFKLVLHGGVTGTQISGDQLGGFDKVGIIAGAGVSASIGSKSEVVFSLLYFQKGSQQRVKTDTITMEVDYYRLRLNYLEIPIGFRYIIREKVILEAGPSFGLLLFSREEDENGELPFERPFYSYDFSLFGSAGYKIRQGLSFRFSYFQGVVPVRPHLSGSTFRLNRGQYTSSVAFTLAYQIRSNARSNKSRD